MSHAQFAASGQHKLPSFTIVVPTYQRRDLVCAGLSALCAVDYAAPIDVIVVVDGSTDGTARALQGITCPFPLKIIEQPNSGAAGARNRGAAEATGDILLFLDDDMMCAPDILREHARMYEEGADAVIGDFPLHPDSPPGFISDTIGRCAAWDRGARAGPFDVFTGQLSVRRRVFEELGGFDEAFGGSEWYGNEDMDFGARLVERYDVRHNPAAISRQLNVVGPREYMRRARRSAAADVHFAAKHPELRSELLKLRGDSYTSTRLLYRPISRIPLLPRMVAAVATLAAEIALKTRFRSNPHVARLFQAGYAVSYWSAFRSAQRRDAAADRG